MRQLSILFLTLLPHFIQAADPVRAPAQIPPRAVVAAKEGKDGMKVGQILIMGNVTIPDLVIRKQLGFGPAQEVTRMQLRLAEQKLANLNLFVVDPASGERPTVTVVEDPCLPQAEFKDVLIRLTERPGNHLLLRLLPVLSRESWRIILP